MERTWMAVRGSVPEICRWVEETARNAGFSEREAGHWVLAVEEVATNIVDYAYRDGPAGMVEVKIDQSAGGMTVIFSDTGWPFNPLDVPDPRIDTPLDEREIGGLGIYLARKVMDRIDYKRRDSKNILVLCKMVLSARGTAPGL